MMSGLLEVVTHLNSVSEGVTDLKGRGVTLIHSTSVKEGESSRSLCQKTERVPSLTTRGEVRYTDFKESKKHNPWTQRRGYFQMSHLEV